MALQTRATLLRDTQGYNMFGMHYCQTMRDVNLDQDVEATVTVPEIINGTLWRVIFKIPPGSTVWVALNTTAAYPTINTFSSTNSEMNPVCWEVVPGDVLHFITADTNAFAEACFYVYE